MAVGDALAAIVSLFRGGTGGPPGGMVSMPWNPDGDERIKGYKCYKAIYQGKHATALADQYKLNTDQLHIVENFPRIVVTVPADLMLGEPFTLDYPDDGAPSDKDQKAITEILKRSKMQINAYEAARDCGHQGDILYTVVQDEDGKSRIKTVSPQIWFPEYDPDDVREILVHRLAWTRVLEEKVQKKYLRVKEHHKGFIVNRLFTLKDGKIEEEIPQSNEVWKKLYPRGVPEREQDTGVDDFLLVHIANDRDSDAYFGTSDYADKKGLFSAVNERTSHNNKILRDHADPSIIVTRSMWNYLLTKGLLAGEGGPGADMRTMKVQKQGENGEKSEYLTWDGKVADAEEFVNRLKEDIFNLCEIDPSLTSAEGMGAIASGRALRLRLVRTLAKVNRKWKYQVEGLEQIIKIAAKLEKIEVEDMTIEKSDGLPADTLEDIQASTARINAGLSSRLREIMRLEDLDEVEAKALLEEIDADSQQQLEQMVKTQEKAKPGAGPGGRSPISVNVGA